MTFLSTLLYLVTMVMQPWEWIAPIANIPVLEIEILVFMLIAILSNPTRFAQVVAFPTTQFFFLYILLSMISVIEESMGMRFAIMEIGYRYIKFFCAYLLITVTLTNSRRIYIALVTIILCGVAVALLCLRLKYTGQGLGNGIGTSGHVLNWRGAVQWIGRFGGSNTTGLLLVTIGAFALALTLSVKQKSTKFFFLLAYLCILFAFYHTHSRGGTIGVMITIGFLIYMHTHIKLSRFLPLALVLGIAFFALKPNEEGRGLGESTSGERVELFYQGLQMVKGEPLLGVGSGRFQDNNPIRKIAHNIYLQQVAETGLLGSFCYFMMFYISIKGVALIRLNETVNDTERIVSMALLSGLVGFGASGFFLSELTELPFVLLALTTAMTINNEFKKLIEIKDLFLVGICLIFAVAAVYTAVNLYNILF